MLVEVDLPNSDRSLYPGMYANMHLKVGAAVQSVRVPDDALIFRNNEIYVPIVRDDRLNLTPVQLGHDNGYTVEVLSKDLHAGDLIAVNVGEAARNGEPVQPVVAKQDM
jgi:multidrug efflux pump subunit AcrA (membrane-fusion protein)